MMMREYFVLIIISPCGDHKVAMYNVFLLYICMISFLNRAEEIYPDVRQKGKKEEHF